MNWDLITQAKSGNPVSDDLSIVPVHPDVSSLWERTSDILQMCLLLDGIAACAQVTFYTSLLGRLPPTLGFVLFFSEGTCFYWRVGGGGDGGVTGGIDKYRFIAPATSFGMRAGEYAPALLVTGRFSWDLDG